MHRPFQKLGLLTTLFLANLGPALAQAPNFVTPTAAEFTHVNPLVARPASTSSFSLSSAVVNNFYGPFDMYLSGWNTPVNGATSEFVYNFTDPGNPLATGLQGAFPYFNVADLEVGAMYNAGTGKLNLLVAYYQLGVGHFLDIYDLETSPVAQVVLTNTMQLSNSTTYGRIRMDFHRIDAAVITWAYPGVGIQTMAGQEGNWSGVTTLDGTPGESGPDVALSHAGDMLAHYVYYNNASGAITKSIVDVNTLLASPGIVSPVVEDVNYTSPGLYDLRAVIDCPDHYDVKNWAYTYTDLSSNIWVRYIDHHSAGTYNTVSVNSGALGNVATAGLYEAYAPALHYGNGGNGGNTGHITVGWYTTNGSALNGYIALEMKEGAGGLVSDPDYMALPNAFTPYSYPYAGMSFSKGSDDAIVPPFLYTTYYDYNNTTDLYQLHHAFHKWNNTAFKGAGAPECDYKSHRPAIVAEQAVAAYPNPFTDHIVSAVSLRDNGLVKLTLTDITGREVGQQESLLTKGKHLLKINSVGTLSPGIYFLNASLNSQRINTQKMIKQ